jgi:tetratricopeptide (TPR) repeat protein
MTGRRTFVAMVLCGVVLLAQSAADRRSPGYAAYERANKQFAAKQFQACMNELDEALRLDPKLVPALTLHARLAMAIDRFDVAREDLEKAIAADPKAAYPQFLYGFQFYQRNEMPAAIRALQRAHQLNPRDASSALYLGLAQESLGNTAEALSLYREAIRLEESGGQPHVETMMACARLLLVLGEFDEAEQVLDRAVRIAPESRDPHFEASRLWLKRGDAARAVREAEAALKLRGEAKDRQVRYVLMQAYQAAGRDADAARESAALRAMEQGK